MGRAAGPSTNLQPPQPVHRTDHKALKTSPLVMSAKPIYGAVRVRPIPAKASATAKSVAGAMEPATRLRAERFTESDG
jgi:hypothetical protein